MVRTTRPVGPVEGRQLLGDRLERALRKGKRRGAAGAATAGRAAVPVPTSAPAAVIAAVPRSTFRRV
ncbi:hypothetical protein ABT116_35785 [Streptomyces sp. NPDC002130]|uniref:hypothetical protein n=1 Tax=Streptomyces sp. NPDC002130 TaxID=3155568 RepID=UPI0033193BC8